MSRKINVSQLQPGMYISELGLDWMSHNFLRGSFAVTDDTIVQRVIASGMQEVYIDPARGLDVIDAPTRREQFGQKSSSKWWKWRKKCRQYPVSRPAMKCQRRA
jgi:hypothetical protein